MAYILLDFDAYRHNLEYLIEKVGDVSKLMAVLKDNAYGHGLKEMSPLAAAVGIKRAVVKNIYEAGIAAPFFEKVLILVEPNPNECVVHDKLIYSACELRALECMPSNTCIHLKIDTGMSRNGIQVEELECAFETINKRNLNLEGVFTHFYGADSPSSGLFVQKNRYELIKARSLELASQYSMPKPFFHSYNSAALLRHKGEFTEDFARVGIASYGYTGIDKNIGSYPLKPVLSLWAQRVSTRVIQQGDIVGYGGIFEAKKKMVISSYDLGYGDGLFRSNGTKTLCVQNGKPFLGSTSMDIFSIEGDEEEVCVFDDVNRMAESFGTINYEIVTKLSPSLKRIVKSGC